MALKIWGFREPVNSNDLNLNFVGLDLRMKTVEQAIAKLLAGGGGSTPSADSASITADQNTLTADAA